MVYIHRFSVLAELHYETHYSLQLLAIPSINIICCKTFSLLSTPTQYFTSHLYRAAVYTSYVWVFETILLYTDKTDSSKAPKSAELYKQCISTQIFLAKQITIRYWLNIYVAVSSSFFLITICIVGGRRIIEISYGLSSHNRSPFQKNLSNLFELPLSSFHQCFHHFYNVCYFIIAKRSSQILIYIIKILSPYINFFRNE